jgi:hypothetical protein
MAVRWLYPRSAGSFRNSSGLFLIRLTLAPQFTSISVEKDEQKVSYLFSFSANPALLYRNLRSQVRRVAAALFKKNTHSLLVWHRLLASRITFESHMRGGVAAWRKFVRFSLLPLCFIVSLKLLRHSWSQRPLKHWSRVLTLWKHGCVSALCCNIACNWLTSCLFNCDWTRCLSFLTTRKVIDSVNLSKFYWTRYWTLMSLNSCKAVCSFYLILRCSSGDRILEPKAK